MKDVEVCDKLRGASNLALIRRFPNGESQPEMVTPKVMASEIGGSPSFCSWPAVMLATFCIPNRPRITHIFLQNIADLFCGYALLTGAVHLLDYSEIISKGLAV